ncbi:MBL fold metallo-hydrolase [Aeromicrobium sp.]|uniref:MBL fold metallo-hydrolase n=1 Tax=Aeromicrobium sp. TaxID=1871063 RepID=UPI0019B61257|nr:MBL fold metallo-hydrolase [Aeromicrobium sp.]MBC7631741.1 MBL fold metallo-hydrolase [Aeromicrobium sp.]
MQITRFGHAAVLVEAADTRVLIDPGMFSLSEVFELEDLDAIVVTHQHPDHIDGQRAPALLERNPGAVLISDPHSATSLGFGDWQPNADGLDTHIKGVTVCGVGAEHAVILPMIPRVANIGVLLAAEGEPTLFHPGDSYEHAPPGVDILALPVSAPWAKVSETIDFITRVAPKTLFPIHDCTISEVGYGVYWQQIVGFGGVDDSRRLGQADSIVV